MHCSVILTFSQEYFVAIILYTCRTSFISLKVNVLAHKSSLALPPLIEVPVPQESELSYICVVPLFL